MLQELVIHDFAIIESLDLSFDTGMTALTGETGAGKSIIIDAVSLLAGARGSSEFVRTGTKKAALQGMFGATTNTRTQEVLDQFGLKLDNGQVLLERDIYSTGRNVCRVNGQLVNTSTLRAVGETLVDIHGQNEHQELTHPDRHIHMLDEYGGPKLQALLNDYQSVFTEYEHRSAALRKKQQNEQEWAQRLDMLRFQVKEINDAELTPSLEDDLIAERDKLANFQHIQEALGNAYSSLSGDEFNPLDVIESVSQSLQSIEDLSPEYKNVSENVASAYYALQDAQTDLSRLADGLEWDEGRLEDVEAQLNTISELKRKYGDSTADIIAYGKKASAELADMEASEADSSGLEETVSKLETRATAAAAALSKARHATAQKLEKAVHEQLRESYMAKTVFSVHFSGDRKQLGPFGSDTLEFYIQPNPGERAQPLAKIASGGELSRIMLALKTIFADADGVTSIIFDEVDTGVSGRVAQAIAMKIAQIAKHSQVLCITHLPQVAAMSDHEYQIQKQIKGKRTMTSVTPLQQDQRVNELARMLAGTEITELTIEHASEMLKQAEDVRAKMRTQS
ncbi:DNA repair protein RecN [Lacticaseibacillus pabuli]|uniref:DNA repair protein RecN n=1 Tax=Lacticaseibacillus pabuli TaxID=3025672 RepID=A0ABY7WU29_9LACO|nr:DNA repair protein RecN [Lacticaseibacillus sp. KACC 23028]WDF83673.1 DNA repair protein RecN [Lacticaseibacillus sp. KACC 23028]